MDEIGFSEMEFKDLFWDDIWYIIIIIFGTKLVLATKMAAI